MTTPSSTTPQSDTDYAGRDYAGQAADSADAAIRSARQRATDVLDGVKSKASATLERLRPQLDSVTSYAKEEPTKALLIAAAAGAGLMALIALSARASRPRMPSARSLREAAADTAGEWRKAASDKADLWRKAAAEATDQASGRADDALKSTKNATQAAYEGLADTMNQWKEHAATLVERVRPQIETVTDYAKGDPGKALLIAAAAGAALMGLVSSLSR